MYRGNKNFVVVVRRALRMFASLWVLHIIGVGFCTLLFFHSMIDLAGMSLVQPFEQVDNDELGSNLFQVQRQGAERIVKIEISYDPEEHHSFQLFYRQGIAAFFTIRFDPRAGIFASKIKDGNSTPAFDLPFLPGRYEVEFADGDVVLFRDRQLLYREEITIDPGFDLFIRLGDSVQYKTVRSLEGISITVGSDNTDEKRILRYSTFRRVLFNTVTGAFIYFVLVILAAFPLAFFISKRRTLAFVLVLLLVMIPVWPLAFWTFYCVKSNQDPIAQVDTQQKALTFRGQTYSFEPEGGTRVVFIGGSAGEGAPFSRQDSMAGVLQRMADDRSVLLQVRNMSQGSWNVGQWLETIDPIMSFLKPDLVIAYLNFNSLTIETSNIALPNFLTLAFFGAVDLLASEYVYDPHKVDQIKGKFLELSQRVQKGGAQLVFLDDPVAPWYIFADAYETSRLELIDYLVNNDIAVISMHDYARAEPGRLWFYDACHLTRHGYRWGAELIWEDLQRRQLIKTEMATLSGKSTDLSPE